MSKRFPNAGYQVIGIICIILVIVEVTGHLQGDGVKIAILIGFAILALLAPKIESLTIGKDGVIADLGAQLQKNSEKISESKSATIELDQQVNLQLQQVFQEVTAIKNALLSIDRITPSVDAGEQNEFMLPPITSKADPQKDRFGGQESRNNRRISAIVEPSSINTDWCKVILTVTSESASHPLDGEVEFYVHDTFKPDHYSVSVVAGNAVLVLRAWGAFTVGAVADNGATLLELDLAQSPAVDAPADWRRR